MKGSLYWIVAIATLAVWLVASWRLVYQTIVGSKSLSSGSSSFFSLKDLFLHFFFLVIAALGYMGGFSVSRFIVQDMHVNSMSPVLSEVSSDQALFIQSLGIMIGCVFFLLLNSLLPEGVRERIVGSGGWKEWGKGVGLGVLVWPAITSVIWLLQFLISGYRGPVPQYAVDALSKILHQPLFFAIIALQISLLVPFLEELLFRGYLLSFLRGTIHPFFAYISNALLFAWMHYSVSQQVSNYAFLPGLFLFGLVAALLRDEKGSLSRVIGLHTGFNAISIAFLATGVGS